MTKEMKAKKVRDKFHVKFLSFPTTSGISGYVFKSKELYISNNATKESKLNTEIDNRSNALDVKDFMIGPVFTEQNPNVPCAIIQFVNKNPDEKTGRA